MTATSEAETFASKSPPFSRLNQPTRPLTLAARRERGLLLRSMIGRVAGKVSLALASRRRSRTARYARIDHRTA